MNIAIITGASSGLGREYARQLDLAIEDRADEFWIIARRREQLEALADELITPCRIFACDLTTDAALTELREAMASEQELEVCWLICAAGFGRIGSYDDLSPDTAAQMIDLNCRALVMLTQTVIPFMSTGSHILEIASCAGFQPVPYLGLYAATKSLVISYSRSLAYELAPQGITVTAVCPYWIKDTEFVGRAQQSHGRYFRHLPLATTAASVVSRSLASARLGRSICTPDALSLLDRLLAALLPDWLIMKASRLLHLL